MPSLREIGQQHYKLKLVCDHLSKYPSVDDNYTLDESGEINMVLLGNNSVIKIPRPNEGRRDVDQEVGAASFEAMLVDKLHDVDEKCPLALPETHDVGLDYSYAMFSRVPGEVLTREQAREFSPVSLILGDLTGKNAR